MLEETDADKKYGQRHGCLGWRWTAYIASNNINMEDIEILSGVIIMYLHYYLDENKQRVYTFKKIDPSGAPTVPAHPARYSVGNEMSKERILIKKRFNILPTQGPPPVY